MGRPRTNSAPLPAWASALAEARKLSGFKSQLEFGKAVGYTQQSVADWESGKRRPPPEAIPEIVRLLGLPAQLLLPPAIAAAMEDQSPLTGASDIDDAVASLVAQVHGTLTEAGAKPTIRNAARLALRMWRQCGGTLTEPADPNRLRLEVQNIRELWRDLSMVHRDQK